jgi:hypothetical protein
MMGIIVRGGAWYTVFDQRIQGRANVVDAVREDLDLFEKLQEEVYKKI